MAKAKTASKNNPTTRMQAKEFLHSGKKIKPVKLVTLKSTFLAAEYETGELVKSQDGSPMPWGRAKG